MTPEPELVEVEPTPTAVIRGSVPVTEITSFYDRSFTEVAAVLGRQGVSPRGTFGRYLAPPADVIELEVGFVVDRAVEADGDVVASTLPGGRVARLIFHGAYDGLGEAWDGLMTWVGDQGLAPAGPVWEVYVTEPTPQTDPSTLRTDLFCPVA
ncbi:GyrI-like domain-containing protein [Ornithinimicrobium pratense]|uniref:AraC family transcriptional regulator n=1 Tax=Ornithinimicrobium pratense TaxID=2593973 RepID=A0A5J6V9W5_9MICO|nr:GyrI-like domain-containing protein [Ornithinimicrobium pratense]QFG69983.1 AraC family transcriptional regulator [Ornithinimicrobium pratense]